MTTPITKDGEYTTRSGLEVRIYSTDGHDSYGGYVHGAIKIHAQAARDGYAWVPASWFSTGVYCGPRQANVAERAYDLIPKPKVWKLDVWFNAYLISGKLMLGDSCESKEAADKMHGSSQRIACIHIQRDVVEGEGLE